MKNETNKNNEIGNRIKYAREHALKNRKLSQAELAKKLNCSRDTIRNWEKGRVIPDNKRLESISAICGVDWKWLLLGDLALLPGSDIITDSYNILNSFNPYEELEKILSSYGYDLKSIKNKDLFFKYIEASVRNAANFFIYFLNEGGGKNEQF